MPKDHCYKTDEARKKYHGNHRFRSSREWRRQLMPSDEEPIFQALAYRHSQAFHQRQTRLARQEDSEAYCGTGGNYRLCA